MSKFNHVVTTIATAAVLAAGLVTATGSMAASRAFDNKLDSVISHVRNDPNYKPIPLDGKADNNWFFDQCNALYTGKINKDQFVADGVAKFPGYDASFKEVAERLTTP